MITVRALTKKFKDIVVFEDFDLDLEVPSVLVGSNGSDAVNTIYGFSGSNILVYDATEKDAAFKLTNTSIFTTDAGTTYDVSFYADTTVDNGLKHFVGLLDTDFP